MKRFYEFRPQTICSKDKRESSNTGTSDACLNKLETSIANVEDFSRRGLHTIISVGEVLVQAQTTNQQLVNFYTEQRSVSIPDASWLNGK